MLWNTKNVHCLPSKAAYHDVKTKFIGQINWTKDKEEITEMTILFRIEGYEKNGILFSGHAANYGDTPRQFMLFPVLLKIIWRSSG
ncbi:hypothetical protein TNIN_272741 [Trichonephila inaurata madagascariensis]|uniref:Uncharacterized protein n=1 Tax=Trichonephila inaurata madagascariensis TaxID=2747483 RepID=A0A8X6Y1A5_9ARAC|nr:hypothetical protein TNIN_272741 [Trichonephila inaurata madagascariensis]